MFKIKTLIKNTLIFLLLFVIVIVLLIPRGLSNPHESFVSSILSGNTSQSIYRDTMKTSKTAADGVALYDELSSSMSFSQTNDDKNYELIMKRCYQYPNTTFDDILNGWLINKHTDIFTQSFSLSTVDFNEVKTKIISNIQNAHDNILNGAIPSPIRGPVYVDIFQVPYYKNSTNKVIDIKSFSISSYNFQAEHNELANNVNSYTQPINYYCIIYYPRYTPNGILNNYDSFTSQEIPKRDRSYVSGQQQCYMYGQGANDGQKIYAGCSSSTGSTNLKNNGLISYVANCFGPKPDNNFLQKDPVDKLTTLSSYGVLYTINTTSLSLKPYFFTKNMTYPTPWQYTVQSQNSTGFKPMRLSSQNQLECLLDSTKNSSQCYITPNTPQSFKNTSAIVNSPSANYQVLPVDSCTQNPSLCQLYTS